MTPQTSPLLPARGCLPERIAIVGAGRMGTALAAELARAEIDVAGPLRRDETLADDARAVLLCVPDGQIAFAAAALPAIPGRLVGHVSAATTLAPLAPHEAFSLHPLMTVTTERAEFAGATAAIAGATPRALALAEALALVLGMRPVQIDDADRAAYHAAASIASNFVVTLAGVAERLAQTAGLEREPLAALAQAAVANWTRLGPERALTGPIARGDVDTVERHREAIADRTPDLLPLYDALARATRDLAAPGVPA